MTDPTERAQEDALYRLLDPSQDFWAVMGIGMFIAGGFLRKRDHGPLAYLPLYLAGLAFFAAWFNLRTGIFDGLTFT